MLGTEERARWLDDSAQAKHDRALAKIMWTMEQEKVNLLPGSPERRGCEKTVEILRVHVPAGPRPA